MSLLDITLEQIIYGLGATILVLGGLNLIQFLISSFINWTWWKKTYRTDLKYLRYYLKHKEEIKKYLDERRLV